MTLAPKAASIRGRLWSSFGLLVLLLAGAGAVGSLSMTATARAMSGALGEIMNQRKLSGRFSSLVMQSTQAVGDFVLHADSATRQEQVQAGWEAHQVQRRLNGLSGGTPEQVALVAQIDARLSAMEVLYARARRYSDLGFPDSARREVDRAGPLVRDLQRMTEQLSTMEVATFVQIAGELRERTTRRAWFLLVLIATALLLAAVSGMVTVSSIINPLRILVSHATELSRGNLSFRTRTALPGEFQILAGAMNQAGISLAKSRKRQRRARAKLRASEQRYRLVAHTTTDLLYDHDIASGRIEFSDSLHAVFGYPEGSAGSTIAWWKTHIHPDDLARATRLLEDALAGQDAVWTSEYRFRRGDGQYAAVQDRGYVVRDDAGRALRVVGSMVDVTAQREAEGALRRSEAGFRAFVEHSPYGTYRSTLDGRFLAVNPALVDMLGYDDPEELLQKRITDVYQNARDRVRLIEAGDTRKTVRAAEVPWKRRDGSPILVRLRAMAIRNEAGEHSHFEGFVEDVTRMREIEQALQQSEKLSALGQLVSGVAHELNNPLAAILLFAEDLLADQRTSRDAEALEAIHHQALRSRAIVRDLLAFVRSREERREYVDLEDYVRRVTDRLRRQLEQMGVALVCENHAVGAVVEIDSAGIEQVVSNLVVNGAQAAKAGGTVTVRASIDGEGALVEVMDSGPGIPEDVRSRIFEPFFTTKRMGEGTGLGLSVSLGIVEQHGGTLQAENQPTGTGGARFLMRLPVVTDPAARAEAAAASSQASEGAGKTAAPAPQPAPAAVANGKQAAAASNGNGKASPAAEDGPKPHILVVDDDDAVRTALVRFFVRRGWRIEEVDDGQAALDRLLGEARDDDPDVIISDFKMPGLSGGAMHDRIAATRPELLPRLVFCTGDVASPEAADFVSRTDCPVFEKPFEFAKLAATLEQIHRANQPAAAE